MVVVHIDTTLPAFSIIAKEKDTVRLGDRDKKTGKLTPEAIARSLAALQRCKDLAESLKADHIVAVATSATREASNGIDFLKRIATEVGIQVDLISGQEEARRIYLGVLSGMDFHHKPHAIIDIGGGSTEIILADSQKPRFLSSTKVGAVRLTREFMTTDPITEEEYNCLRAFIRGMLERPIEQLKMKLQPEEIPRLVGTSGTIETLITIHALQEIGEVPNPLQGYQMSRKNLKEIVKKLAHSSYEERLNIAGLLEKRADIILAGAMILLEAMNMLEIDTLILCERALREGVIVDWMLSRGLIDNRLQYQGEIRHRSIIKIARKYKVELAYEERIAEFALSLFDQTHNILHRWGAEERELLWGASILHNCGLFISHSSHHKHSYYLIRNAELLGYSEMELEVLANIARYHRKSKPKKKHEAYSKLPEQQRRMVRELSAILRIAVALDRRQIGAISSVECKFDPEYRQLHLHLIPSNPKDDCALELWSLDYKKGILEEEFEVKLVTTLESATAMAVFQ
ncbi:MAG: Ppx/GppA phosphatase family protein [Microcystaceae cyanobacterium]